MTRRALLMMALLTSACQGFERVASPLDSTTAHDASVDRVPYDDLGCGSCEPRALAQGLQHVVAIDVDDAHVYWADAANLQSHAHIGRVPKVGCAAGVQCTEVVTAERFSITALRLSQGHLFWTERFDENFSDDSGSLWRLDLAGGQPVAVATEQTQPVDLLVHDDTLYWANEAELRRRDAWQSSATTEVLQNLLPRPNALAISMGRIFFTNLGNGVVYGYVASTRLDGSDWQVIAQNQKQPVAIAVGPLYVYWADSARGVVMRAQSDGQGLTSAFLSNLLSPNALLIHEGVLYVSEGGSADDRSDGRIFAVRLDGTGRATLAESQNQPTALAIDEGALYWANYGKRGTTVLDSSVMRLDLP